jgi:hypothetical protein
MAVPTVDAIRLLETISHSGAAMITPTTFLAAAELVRSQVASVRAGIAGELFIEIPTVELDTAAAQ